jgi:hypothetical protein
MVLGYLGPNDVQGTMPTQDGRSVVVTGKGGDIKVNDNRVSCAYAARGAYIYMIDTVLTPPTPAAEAADSATSSTSSTATTTATTSESASPTTSAAPATSETPSVAAETTTPKAAA